MDEIKKEVVSKADAIADALKRGKDVEIRRYKDGITMLEVDKRTIRDTDNGWENVSK